jgi:hypothetical protein
VVLSGVHGWFGMSRRVLLVHFGRLIGVSSGSENVGP